MATKKFYVDIDQLAQYADFLSKMMIANNNLVTTISKENKIISNTTRDSVTMEVDQRIKKLKRILDKFNVEVNHLSKKVKEDAVLYRNYNSPLK